MSVYNYPNYRVRNGHLTEGIRYCFIDDSISKNLLPEGAHRIPEIISLVASNNTAEPIQFWQLFSVLGKDRIIGIVDNFYQRVFSDEEWFRSVFERVGDKDHHIESQSSMWIDVMGGGPYYKGGEFRLSYHHTYNAYQIMNEKGVQRWVRLMAEALDDSADYMTADHRVRPSINTLLAYFLTKYAASFNFCIRDTFGDINQPLHRK